MNRFVQPLSKVAAAGILVAAVGLPSLALAAGTGTPATGTSMTKPVAQATMPTKASKPMMAKSTTRMTKTKWTAEVRSVQEALNKHGAKLHVDGRLGPKTHAALKTYQMAHGLKATGRIDKATRHSLKIA